MMKHTKMSRRTSPPVDRAELEQLEQQRIDFEHRARLARENLYGMIRPDQHGWMDKKTQ